MPELEPHSYGKVIEYKKIFIDNKRTTKKKMYDP